MPGSTWDIRGLLGSVLLDRPKQVSFGESVFSVFLGSSPQKTVPSSSHPDLAEGQWHQAVMEREPSCLISKHGSAFTAQEAQGKVPGFSGGFVL